VPTFCSRCGQRSVQNPRFCIACMGGEADPARARELVEAAERGDLDALRLLAEIDDTRATDVLLGVAERAIPPVRAAALRSLAAVGDPTALPLVLGALSDVDAGVRAGAIECLAELGGEEAAEALAIHMDHPEDGSRAAAALAWLGDERAIPHLIRALEALRHSHNVYRGPAMILGRLGDARAVAPMVAVLERMAERWIATQARAGGPPRPDWAARMVAQEVATGLAMIGGDEAEAALARAQERFGEGPLLYPITGSAEEQFAYRAPADPRRTVPRWSLELRRADLPVSEPVTKFGGQPVWLEAPTWPIAADGGPMTFMAQFRVPGEDGLAYLFIDPSDPDDLDFSDPGFGGCLLLQPGPPPARHLAQDVGPTYASEIQVLERFEPRSLWRLVEYLPALEEGLDFPDWTPLAQELALDRDDHRDWNKLGGSPRYLQGGPPAGQWRFLFQFTAALVGREMADGAECYGLMDGDRRGLFLVESH
jgi:HEAT repeat protein